MPGSSSVTYRSDVTGAVAGPVGSRCMSASVAFAPSYPPPGAFTRNVHRSGSGREERVCTSREREGFVGEPRDGREPGVERGPDPTVLRVLGDRCARRRGKLARLLL